MKRVTGLGGFFFKAKNPKTLGRWYKDHLGVPIDESFGGYTFNWCNVDDPDEKGFTIWSPFRENTDYFDPSEKEFMINFRVDDLEALLEQLKQEGIGQVGEIDNNEFGKFAWIIDPEGNKIELWEPAKENR